MHVDLIKVPLPPIRSGARFLQLVQMGIVGVRELTAHPISQSLEMTSNIKARATFLLLFYLPFLVDIYDRIYSRLLLNGRCLIYGLERT